MISLSSTEVIRFTPPWHTGDNPPVYLMIAGSVLDRAALEAELAGEHNAGRTYAWEKAEAFKAGLLELSGPSDERDVVLSLAMSEMAGEPLTEEEQTLLKSVTDEIARFYQPYREIRARQARRIELAPILAFRRFIIGWEGLDIPFQRGPDRKIADASMRLVDMLDLMAAGSHAFTLLYPSEDTAGNSKPASSSDEGQATSSSDQKLPEGGKSASGSGKKTRSKPSRNGSSPS